MLYGPNHSDVQAFIASLPSLTYADWDAAKMYAAARVLNLYEALDEASFEVVGALQDDPVLDRALTAAKAETIPAVDNLGWSSANPELKQDVLSALGAIIVLGAVEFEKVVIRFLPFRQTAVVVPVKWER